MNRDNLDDEHDDPLDETKRQQSLSNLESAANVHEAIVAVRVACPYVQKQRTQGLNYAYLGIDSTLQELLPALNLARLSIVPLSEGARMLRADTFKTSKGTVMQRAIVKSVYRITHAPSETFIDCCGFGESSDAGDKSFAKARTSALKDALRQLFLLKSGDIDPDTKLSEELGATTEKWNRAEQALMNCKTSDALEKVWQRVLERPFSAHQMDSLNRTYKIARGLVAEREAGAKQAAAKAAGHSNPVMRATANGIHKK